MSRFSDRVIVITGSTDGLGRAVAQALSTAPSTRLLLHGRNEQKLADVRRAFAGAEAKVDVVRADLSVLAQVHQLADEILEMTDHVDVLINNAGVGFGDRAVTVDGNELGFAVNYLAPFALTQRLLPALDAAAPSRVVNVAAAYQEPIDFDDLTLSSDYSGRRSSGVSKLAMITSGFALAARLDPQRTTVNSVHPAKYMPTRMVLETVGYTVDRLEDGVESVMNLVENPSLAGVTGRYFDRTAEARPLADAYDQAIQERLWSLSEQLTGRV